MKYNFNGSVSAQAQAGETVTITVTMPNSLLDVFTALTLADKTYSIIREYKVAGTYKAKAHGDADGEYTSWDSAEKTFVVELAARTGTLDVTLA